MEKQEATRTCGQCHKEVAEANFALHETHCKRFLCLCPDCEEPVPREQLEQHREEQHTQVKCSKCNKKVERCNLLDHETDECVERLQSCQFCELEMPWKELDEHSVACGSRTELCRDCGRYVKLRDRPEHDLTCSATDDDSGPPQTNTKPPPKNTKQTVSCGICKASIPVEDLGKHKLECVPTSRSNNEEDDGEDDGEDEEQTEQQFDFSSRGTMSWLSSTYKSTSLPDRASRSLRSWDDEGDPNTISTCPHCHLALPLPTLLWHQRKCQIHICLK
ncbi:XIAP-associated factor 1 [Symphorus nematophorus]